MIAVVVSAPAMGEAVLDPANTHITTTRIRALMSA